MNILTMALVLISPAFAPGEPIPQEYTCEGADVSPPLEWSDAPAGTQSFVLIVDDPDVPTPEMPTRSWVHWVIYNLPATTSSLAKDQSRALPAGTREGLNDWQRTGWGGPCPPSGRHRYFYRLYALDTTLPELERTDKPALLAAMEGHVLAQTELIGSYQKRQQ